MENGLTLLAHASMRFEYWDIAFRTSIFLINRLPTSTLHGQNPFETLFGQKPEYTSLKVFGCSCFPNTKHFNNHKLQFKPVECTFLGYSINHKGYKCLDPNGKIIIFRDVISDEFSFPFAKNKTNNMGTSTEQPRLTIPHVTPKNTVPLISQIHPDPPDTSEDPPIVTCPSSNPEHTTDNNQTEQIPQSIPPVNNYTMQTREKSGIFKRKVCSVNKEPVTTPSKNTGSQL